MRGAFASWNCLARGRDSTLHVPASWQPEQPLVAEHEPVGDAPEAAQTVQALAHQVDLIIASDLADRHPAVRIGAKKVWPALQPVNDFAGAQVLSSRARSDSPPP